MKPLLNTLFITTEGVYLNLNGDTIVIQKEKKVLARFPLHNFEQITVFGYTGASPALMQKCAEQNIVLNFMTPGGRFMARVIGKTNGNVLLRKEQYRCSDDEKKSLLYAQGFLVGKIYNSRWILERMLRDHSDRIEVERFRQGSMQLKQACQDIVQSESLDILRGIEGKSAKAYFSLFDAMILQQKEDFFFTERNRRPPLDRMNCLLSFLYALLANDAGAALEGVGLDSYVGFLHRDRPGRNSLALDLMEELRPVMADRLALALVNRKSICSQDFREESSGAVLLTDDGRKKVLKAWHDMKEGTVKHPYLKETVKWGLVPHTQALLLARALRGDLDAYPPFLWK
ncbi:type I-C CRISPR-associated endonuclease Cas1c [Mitsuokella jalaludinii]|uniref:type I-C CRISPR-associated endonuclease Cas1c n=1 Tax=Mitsuokella jalaludinii TaxID=187979 RepID=UPI0030807019